MQKIALLFMKRGIPSLFSLHSQCNEQWSSYKLYCLCRCMAADELSKVPDKGLTNAQKVLIIATKLWQAQGDSHQQDYQIKRELVNSSCTSDGSQRDPLGHKRRTPFGEETTLVNNDGHNEAACSDHHQLPSKNVEPLGSTRTPPTYAEASGARKSMEVLKSPPPSTSLEMENFSFHPSASEDKLTPRHLFPANSPQRDGQVLQRMPSCPERTTTMPFCSEIEHVTGNCQSGPSTDKKYESPRKSPKRSSSLPSSATGGHPSDAPDHVQARHFIDLKYQELEEKLLKSPTKGTVSLKSTPESSPARLSNRRQPDVVSHFEPEVSLQSTDTFIAEVQPTSEGDARSISSGSTPPPPLMNPFFGCESVRLWQPLSPVREVDSAQTSVEDLEKTSVSQPSVSGSVDSPFTSDLKSSVGTVLSGSDWEQQEGSSRQFDDMSEVQDNDLFTLSPRRLHNSYNPWDDDHRLDTDVEGERKMVLHVDSESVTDDEESDLNDFVPIQCQSPVFSPKHNYISSRSKSAKEKILKVEDYARDKYFRDMGLDVEEFLASSDPCMSNNSVGPVQGNHDKGAEIRQSPVTSGDSPGARKENKGGMEIPVVGLGQVKMAGPLKETSPIPKKALVAANDMTLSSQDFDHPVLASIENLPTWIESHGGPTSSINSMETQHQDPHHDARSERSSSNTGGEGNADKDNQSPTQELAKDSKLEPGVDLSTLEFSVKQDEPSHYAFDNLDQEARLRLSLHGFVYPDEHVLNLYHSRSLSMENLVQEQSEDLHQNEIEKMVNQLSYPGKQDMLDSFATQFVSKCNGAACLGEVEDEQSVDLVDSASRLDSDSEDPTQQQVEKEKTGILEIDAGHDMLSHDQSLGYSIQLPKLRVDSSSCNEDAFGSPRLGGGSEVSTATSRDGDDSFHDCESPTMSESDAKITQFNGSRRADASSEPWIGRASDSSNRHKEPPAARRIADISPDDRPILGTVATHWAENNDLKALREWDGLGIPNSTSKFKEVRRRNSGLLSTHYPVVSESQFYRADVLSNVSCCWKHCLTTVPKRNDGINALRPTNFLFKFSEFK